MRADARQKREQLIQAAVENFRTRPNSEVTLGEIAEHAGVGIATLYRHFPTRADLRQACALEFIDVLDAKLGETLAKFDSAPEEQWRAFIWACVDSGIGMLVAALADEPPHALEPTVRQRRDEFFAHVQELLDLAAPHGLVDPALTPSEIAAELIVVTRPMSANLRDLFPDVKTRLVNHLLLAWRVDAS